MRILLSGASGFVGSHVLRHLLADGGHDVAILARAPGEARRIVDLLEHVTIITGDLAELPTVETDIMDFAPDAVVHLAWTGVGNRDRNDECQIENLGHTIALVRMARIAGARHWIGLGSQAEYGPHNGVIDEDARTNPTTLYGITKLSACHYTRHLCAEYGLRWAWLRLFSSYGPDDNTGWLIPSITLQLLRQECPPLTAGAQQWDFLYATDVAAAIGRTLSTPTAKGIFNLGSGRAHTIRSVAERVRDLIDHALPLGFGEVPYRRGQVMHLQADIERLRAETGWSPQVSLEDGLPQTVEWYREHCLQLNH